MWKQLSPESAGDWDRLLERARDDNPFQSEAWGRYKQRSGWEPQRWTASVNGGPVVCSVQLLKKRLLFGRTVLWAPGGPMIGFPEATPQELKELLPEGIRQICRTHRVGYARFYSLQPSDPDMRRVLSGICAVPGRKLGSGATVQIDLTPPMEQILGEMDKKHRYLVRRLGEESFQWSWGTSDELAADLSRLHSEMAAAKRVSASDASDFSRLITDFQENARILIGTSGSEPVTGCLVLLKGKSAFYWRAASSRKGRELSASYAMIPELLRRLKAGGFQRFDFGGILPGDPSAAGINHFKQGFGGKRVEYLGEWEWANPSWIRWGVNAWIAGRRRW